ncbi:MAG: hypothetical protein MKZ95_08185, partial [Pirellulales bacterium]|nr:hypothetical protein [Pirellulales bacterium]
GGGGGGGGTTTTPNHHSWGDPTNLGMRVAFHRYPLGYAREWQGPSGAGASNRRPVRWYQGNMIQAYLAGDVCHGAYRAVE